MINFFKYSLAIALLFTVTASFSASPWEKYAHLFSPVRNYVAYKTTNTITIDGKANEASWRAAAWSDYFVDIEGDKQPKPLYPTRMKMLWDTENLYILTELEEPNIWATYAQRDLIVYHENDIEVFIDANGDGANYFEFEVNAINTLFDLFLPLSYRAGGAPLISYDARSFTSAVSIEGSLNNGSDTDSKWFAEMKIPFADLQVWDGSEDPKDGTQWRIDLSRVNWQTEWVDGKYQKKINPETGKAYPEYNWVWSAPGIISMHAPERYGLLQFADVPVGSQTVPFVAPADQPVRDCCWLVYYTQKEFQSKNGRFAATLRELGIPVELERDGKLFSIKMEATSQQFTVMCSSSAGLSYRLNDEAVITKLKQ